MVNTCVVQGCVVGTLKQNVPLPCVQSTLLSLDFVNDDENQKGYAKKRVINKTAVPAIFPSKLSDSQRSVKKIDGLGDNVPVVCGFCDWSFFFSTLYRNVDGVAGVAWKTAPVE